MIFTRTLDASLAIAVALAMLVLVIIKGDALYLGLWYYIAVPVVVLGTCAAFRPAPLFLFGAAFAIAISMLALMSVNWRAASPEGLLGLGHIFSLPGAFVVVLGTAFVARKKQMVRPFAAFLLGLGGCGGGYFINQLVVCNTVMWCGSLSLPIK
jgi:hypothetical protein